MKIITESQKNIFRDEPIADIKQIPQDATALASTLDNADGPTSFKAYSRAFYMPWTNPQMLTEELIAAPFHRSHDRYGEDFARYPESWFEGLLKNAAIHKINSVNQPALVIQDTSLRNMPTMRPAYVDPRLAGEGYPFDTIQENLLRRGDPIHISHVTKDGRFACVSTNAKSVGFVPREMLKKVDGQPNSEIMMITADATNITTNLTTDNVAVTTDYTNVTDDDGNYIPPFALGTVVDPAQHICIDRDNYITSPLMLNEENAAMVINRLINKPYGWGGYLQNRDCAQLLKDYFALFGIHIPIFSAEQIKVGQVIGLENMSREEKLAALATQAVPLRTILYRPGHVTLYVGTDASGMPLMFHAVWGVSLYQDGDQYRHIIGKSVITSLEYGSELPGFDPARSSFLNLMNKMTVIQ